LLLSFLFFLGEEGREEKRRKGKGRKTIPSLITATMKNKKASMIISSLRLFEISFSR